MAGTRAEGQNWLQECMKKKKRVYEGTLWGEETMLYLVCGGGYVIVCICQKIHTMVH